MRLATFVSACAIATALLAPSWSAAAPSSAHASWALPEGAFVAKDPVALAVDVGGFSNATRSFAGALVMDGAIVATVLESTEARAGSATLLFVVPGDVASGPHAFAARVWNDRNESADTGPATFVVHARPRLDVGASSFDWTTKTAHLTGNASDPDAGLALVAVAAGNLTANANVANGTWSADLVVPNAVPGAYAFNVTAVADDGLAARASGTFWAPNREGLVTILDWAVRPGPALVVHAAATDPDGVVKVTLLTRGVAFPLRYDNKSGDYTNAVALPFEEGTFNATVRAEDPYRGATDATFRYDVVRIHRVVFDEDVTAQAGGLVDASSAPIPRILSGSVHVCIADCASPTPSPGSAVVVTNDTAALCVTTVTTECALPPMLPTTLRVARATAMTHLHVRIEVDTL